MNSIYIVIIEPTELPNEVLERQLSSSLKEKVVLQRYSIKSLEASLKDKQLFYDLVLLGEKLTPRNSFVAARTFREKNFTMPILQMTNVSEAKLSYTQKNAGIDDLLDIAELTLPTFTWTLLSVLKNSEVKKKADEFDTIRNSLFDLNSQLTSITHDINNPLGVISLAAFQMQNKNISEKNKQKYLKMINDNLDKLEIQVNNLRIVRSKIKNDQTILSKVISKTENLKIG